MDEEKICPINPHGNGYCKKSKCELWVNVGDESMCAYRSMAIMIEDIRFHVKQIDIQGIGVYNQDDGL